MTERERAREIERESEVGGWFYWTTVTRPTRGSQRHDMTYARFKSSAEVQTGGCPGYFGVSRFKSTSDMQAPRFPKGRRGSNKQDFQSAEVPDPYNIRLFHFGHDLAEVPPEAPRAVQVGAEVPSRCQFGRGHAT